VVRHLHDISAEVLLRFEQRFLRLFLNVAGQQGRPFTELQSQNERVVVGGSLTAGWWP
jgi:hypothetical protein